MPYIVNHQSSLWPQTSLPHHQHELPAEDQWWDVNPDMTITITVVDNASSVVLVPCVGECTLLEDRVHIFNKVESEIIAHPDTLLAIIVLVHEGMYYYTCPALNSITSQELHNGDENPQPLPLDCLICQWTTLWAFVMPIRVAEHDWCLVQSVEYYVWVKGDNQDRIDICDNDPQFMAHGVSHINGCLNSSDYLCRHWAPSWTWTPSLPL